MDWNAAETWRWIWLASAGGFLIAEMVTPAAFFFLPFAIGAGAAAMAAFAGAGIGIEWLLFVALSVVTFALLWPLGRRLESRAEPAAIGANRWVGREAVVLSDIPAEPGGTGLVRLERERWRAESGARTAIPAGSTVLVTRVDGTRLVVLPLEIPPAVSPPTLPEGGT